MQPKVANVFALLLLLAPGVHCASAADDIMSLLLYPGQAILTPLNNSQSIAALKPVNPPPPGKLVFAHHIVGNTFNYNVDSWAAGELSGLRVLTQYTFNALFTDIKLASSKGIDAFALNVGSDSWEPSQVANAFAAARKLATPFKLFFSFDMSSLPCATGNDGTALRNYIRTYAAHPNQLLYNSRVFVSTFAGESCTFGRASVNDGWRYTLKVGLPDVHFVPAFFVDPATFPQYTVIDGAFNVRCWALTYVETK